MSYLAFPPPSGPLLVPTSSRRALRAGVALWSASRLRARAVQRTFWLVGGMMGPGFIPVRRLPTVEAIPEEIEREHDPVWHTWFGGWDERAVYRPSQTDRTGVALLLLRKGRPRGFVKVRPRWDAGPELRATSRLGEAETFTAPVVLGTHDAGGWTSLGYVALSGRIHSPKVSAPVRTISEEVSELVRLDSPGPPGWRPMHGDMGPWNLRNMPGIGPVLFDWESVAHAPPFADEVFYLAAAKAVGLAVQRHSDLDEAAMSFWRDRISGRLGGDRRDDRLATDMLQALVSFER